MEKNIYFFRHGQTNSNLEQRWQGQTDSLLNKTGFEQANRLGIQLSNIKFDVIYTSPLLRAVQTALTVAGHQKTNVNVVIMKNLREGNFGDVEGKTFSETQEIYHEKIQEFFFPTKENWDFSFPGGESKHQIFDRIFDCLQEIALRPGKNIGICNHGGSISALTCGLNLSNVSFGNCSVLALGYNTETNTFFQPY